jgi:hypothetical protein
MGTRGEIYGDGRHVTVYDFLAQKETVYDSRKEDDGGIASGHGGGDYGMAKAFVSAVAAGDPTLVTSGPDVSLESHLIVFAAERARLNGTVEEIVLEK